MIKALLHTTIVSINDKGPVTYVSTIVSINDKGPVIYNDCLYKW